ncbi:MAG: hypothetical protein HWE10_10520 [Gammaproteobacteria bacterium]|nr:hypothetical protein [Gammaproteobacteria bacterium]
MEQTQTYYRIQIVNASLYRVIYQVLLSSLCLFVTYSWPYSLPSIVWACFYLCFIIWLIYWVRAELIAASDDTVTILHVYQNGMLEFEHCNEELDQHSFYLAGVFRLVSRNVLTGAVVKRVIFADQLSNTDNRRLRRIILPLASLSDDA